MACQAASGSPAHALSTAPSISSWTSFSSLPWLCYLVKRDSRLRTSSSFALPLSFVPRRRCSIAVAFRILSLSASVLRAAFTRSVKRRRHSNHSLAPSVHWWRCLVFLRARRCQFHPCLLHFHAGQEVLVIQFLPSQSYTPEVALPLALSFI